MTKLLTPTWGNTGRGAMCVSVWLKCILSALFLYPGSSLAFFSFPAFSSSSLLSSGVLLHPPQNLSGFKLLKQFHPFSLISLLSLSNCASLELLSSSIPFAGLYTGFWMFGQWASEIICRTVSRAAVTQAASNYVFQAPPLSSSPLHS